MSTFLTLLADVDLLRERRSELGLPDPRQRQVQQRALLRKASGWGLGIVAGVAALGVLITVRQQMVQADLAGLAPLEAELASLQRQQQQAQEALLRLRGGNSSLVKELVSARSGSALMRELQLRVPRGVQLQEVKEASGGLTINGLAQDPQSFARLNALELQLQQSPLLKPDSIRLTKAARLPADAQNPQQAGKVSFSISAQLAEGLTAAQELEILRDLGADGKARRLQLLQREGLLQ